MTAHQPLPHRETTIRSSICSDLAQGQMKSRYIDMRSSRPSRPPRLRFIASSRSALPLAHLLSRCRRLSISRLVKREGETGGFRTGRAIPTRTISRVTSTQLWERIQADSQFLESRRGGWNEVRKFLAIICNRHEFCCSSRLGLHSRFTLL